MENRSPSNQNQRPGSGAGFADKREMGLMQRRMNNIYLNGKRQAVTSEAIYLKSPGGFLILALTSGTPTAGIYPGNVYASVKADDGTAALVLVDSAVDAMPLDNLASGAVLSTSIRYACFAVGDHYEFLSGALA